MFILVELSNLNIKNGLCISIGANIDSNYGKPIESLIICKPRVEEVIKCWINQSQSFRKETDSSKTIFYWSSIYESIPHGVKDDQPNYLNTLLLVKSKIFPKRTKENAKFLLKEFKNLERNFGRKETSFNMKWLSRCLDLDILWWEDFSFKDEELTLPHPRFMNRNFVISPLSEVLSRAQTVKKIEEPRWLVD